MVRVTVDPPIPEKTTRFLDGQLLDQDEIGVPGASLTAFLWTLYDVASGQILNGRDHQSVLNANGGTIDAQGRFTIELTPADTVIVDGARDEEVHAALLEWAWVGPGGQARQEKVEVLLRIVNLAKVV